MKIEKYYERNVNLGNYESARVGLKIVYDKEITSKEQLKEVSDKLLKMGKNIVEAELKQLKEEKENG